MSDAFARGFQQSFFSGPEIKEGDVLLVGGQLLKSSIFARGKKARDQLVDVGYRTDVFDIDANRAKVGYRDERQIFRVSEVEKQAGFCKAAREGRFATRAIFKLEFIGRAI